MDQFTQQSVDHNGGVAWAKDVAAAMDPGAVGDQISGYWQTADSMANVVSTLRRIKSNLAATWTGDASDQAQMAFQSTVDHAQLIHDTITEEIIRPLQTAQSAQQTFVSAMRNVPDEKPVPSTNMLESGYDYFTGQATPTQQAQAHNIQARYKSALALNALSASYGDAAAKLKSVAGKQDKFTQNSDDNAFDLGPVASSSGDGAASNYSQSIRSGSTTTAGYVSAATARSTSISARSQAAATTHSTSPTAPGLISVDPATVVAGLGREDRGTSSGGVITDEPMGTGTGNRVSLGVLPGTGGGVFDGTGGVAEETTGGDGSGLRSGSTSGDDGDSLGNGENAERGSRSSSADESSEDNFDQGRERGAPGFAEDEDELGSSQYSRGRYFDIDDGDGIPGLPSVRSVYEDATDAQGNKLNLLAPTRRSGARAEDDEDERGKRPSNLKEDKPWDSAQRIVPPVIS